MAASDETPDGPIRVVYADESFLMREALERILERLERPLVVVTDMRMPPSGDDPALGHAPAGVDRDS